MGGGGAQGEPPAVALWVALVAGVSGGVCNVLVGHPFDTIKVRAQAGRPLFKGSLFTGILGQLLGVRMMATMRPLSLLPSSLSFPFPLVSRCSAARSHSRRRVPSA
jgi:hypothetical protein